MFYIKSYCWSRIFFLTFFKILFNFKKFFKFTFERERESVSGGGAEREGDTESEADSRLPAVSTEPNEGLKPMNHEIMT